MWELFPVGRNNIFAHNLVNLMKNDGMTVRQASKLAGVAVSTIQNWRSGSSPNDYVAVRKLANALGTSLAWLLTGENDEVSKNQVMLCDASHESKPFFSGYAYVTVHKIVPKEELRGSTQGSDDDIMHHETIQSLSESSEPQLVEEPPH